MSNKYYNEHFEQWLRQMAGHGNAGMLIKMSSSPSGEKTKMVLSEKMA